MEQAKRGPGHWHIEGYCACKMGRIWAVQELSPVCIGQGGGDPTLPVVYRSSLSMVRDFIHYTHYGS
jgi:hypothetical protein